MPTCSKMDSQKSERRENSHKVTRVGCETALEATFTCVVMLLPSEKKKLRLMESKYSLAVCNLRGLIAAVFMICDVNEKATHIAAFYNFPVQHW